MARLPKLERGGSGESSDSNLLAIAGIGVAAVVGMLVLTGQGPFGGGSAAEEPAPIPANPSGAAAASAAPGAPGAAEAKQTANKTNRQAGANAKPEDKAAGAKQGKKQRQPKTPSNDKSGAAPTGGSGDVTDRYLDCMAKAQGKKEIDRCAEIVGGA